MPPSTAPTETTSEVPTESPALGGETLDSRLLAKREDAAWFRSLARTEQDAFRDRWHQEDVLAGVRSEHRRFSLRQTSLRGAGVFLIGALMFVQGGFVGLAVTTAVGAMIGLCFGLLDMGPLRSAVVAGPIFSVLVVAFRPDYLGVIFAMFAFLIVAPFMYLAAVTGRMEQSDGRE